MTKTIFYSGKAVSVSYLNSAQYLGPSNPGVVFVPNPINDWEYPLLKNNSLDLPDLGAYFVTTTANQSIDGTKTFTSIPEFPASSLQTGQQGVNVTRLVTDLNALNTDLSDQIAASNLTINAAINSVVTDLNANYVKIATTQTITGSKTFTNIKVPLPVDPTDATPKTYVDNAAKSAVPIGAITEYAGTSAPSNWLFADGASLAAVSYPELFAVIGYTYGGSGPAFNLPDRRGRMAIGANADRALASTGGSNNLVITGEVTDSHTLTPAQMPGHSHQLFVQDLTDSDPRNQPHIAFNDTFGGLAANISTDVPESGTSANQLYGATNANNINFVSSEGGNQAHSHGLNLVDVTNGNLPAYIALNYIIKVS